MKARRLIKIYCKFLNQTLKFRKKVIVIVTVFVEDIATAFDEHFSDWQQFLNTKTGEIVILSNDGVLDTDKELAEEIDSTDDYIRLPGQYELHEYRIMENFADTVTNEKMASKLWRALNGKKPFRHFKDTIYYLGIAQDYYKFRFKAYLDIAGDKTELTYDDKTFTGKDEETGEEESIPYTLDGDKLTLSKDGSKMVFKKK